MPWGPNGEWIWETPKSDTAATPADQTPSHPYYGLAIRTIAPMFSSEGGPIGAFTAGLGERMAEWAEGSPENKLRIAAEAGLGLIPGNAVIKGGRILGSAVKSGILAGGGEALREWAKNGADSISLPDVLRATGTGALFGAGGAKFLGHYFPNLGKGTTKAAETAAEEVPAEVKVAGPVVTPKTPSGSPQPFVEKNIDLPTEVKPSTINVTQGPTKTSFPIVYKPGYGKATYEGNPGGELQSTVGGQIGHGNPVDVEVGGPTPVAVGNQHNADIQFATWAQAQSEAKKIGGTVQKVTKGPDGMPLDKPRYVVVGKGFTRNPDLTQKSATGAIERGTDFAGHVGPALGLDVSTVVPDVPPTINKAMTAAEATQKINDETAQNVAELQNRKNALANTLSPTNRFLNPEGATETVPQSILGRFITDPTGEVVIKGKRVRNVPTSPAEVAERTGVSAGSTKYNPEANVAASPISGAVVASPEGPGSRQGYLFGEHNPQTLDKARRAGDTILKFIKGESGEADPQAMLDNLSNYFEKNPQAALRVGLGAAGAGIGAIRDQDDPLTGALVGGATGAALPSVPKMLTHIGINPEMMKGVDLTTPEGIKDFATKAMYTLPQVQRFNYLTSITGLPINALVGPYGAAFTGALERAITGDARGWKALQMLKNPANFYNLAMDPATRAEAERLMKAASTPERALQDVGDKNLPWGQAPTSEAMGKEIHDMEEKGFKGITDKLKFPGEFMVQGDEAARHILKAAGYSEDEARLMTMTNEPRSEYGRGLAHFGAGNPLLQLLFPFRRTPVNMAEGGLERIPGVGFAMHGIQSGKKNIVDPMKLQIVQQALGVPAFFGGYLAGNNIQDEGNAKFARRFLTNLAGKYSLPVSAGFAAGQAHQAGKPIWAAAAKRGIQEAAPLPSVSAANDIVNFANGGNVPRGWLPEPLYDLLLNRNIITGAK